MLTRLLIAVIALLGLTAWRDTEPEWPFAGPMPDEPGHSSRYSYEAIYKGTRSYRPVDPMPWGDVNRRVAPPGALPPDTPDAKSKPPPMEMKPAEPEKRDGQ